MNKKITCKVVGTQESREFTVEWFSITTPESDVLFAKLVECSTSQLAELELTHPELGWRIFPN